MPEKTQVGKMETFEKVRVEGEPVEVVLDYSVFREMWEGAPPAADEMLEFVINSIIAPLMKALGYELEYEVFVWGESETGNRWYSDDYKKFTEKLLEKEKYSVDPGIRYAREKGADMVIHLGDVEEWSTVLVWLRKREK